MHSNHNLHTGTIAGRQRGFTLSACVIGLCLIAAGISIVASIITFTKDKIPKAPELAPFHLALLWAKDAQRDGKTQEAFHYFGQAIDRAAFPAQRNQAVLETIDFLLHEPRNWRPIRQRHLMAAEYIRALMESENRPISRMNDLATWSLELAEALQDTNLLAVAERIMQEYEATPDMLLLAFDAYFAMNQPAKAIQTLVNMKGRKRTAQQDDAFAYRRMIALDRARREPEWLKAGGSRYQSLSPDERPAWMQTQLQEEAKGLMRSPVTEHAYTARLKAAEIALEQNARNQAIEYLRSAVKMVSVPNRNDAAALLLQLLRKQGQMRDADDTRDELMSDPNTMRAAYADLLAQFDIADTPEKQEPLLETVDIIVGFTHEGRPDPGELLLRAARTAINLKNAERAKSYLEHDEKQDRRYRRAADRQLLRAHIAGIEGNPRLKIRILHALIATAPSDAVDREARFLLFDTLAENPEATVDLTGTVVGMTVRFPDDPRIVEKLLVTAERLEQLSLFPAAEVYYRQAALLGTLHTHRKTIAPAVAARAMLGQARVLMATGRTLDADQLLRTINAQELWSSVWPEAGPLWASIAMLQNQPREALRRWRQTSGPPSGTLIPHLFQILIPDLEEIKALPNNLVRKPAAGAPRIMVKAATDAAMEKLLAEHDYDRIAELLILIEKDALWSQQIPTESYRVQVLEHMLARETIPTVREWMALHGIKVPSQQGTLLTSSALLAQLTELETIHQQAQQMVF